MADGDGRYLLNMVEAVLAHGGDEDIDTARLTEVVQRRVPLYDKSQDGHYNLISALHKSLRGSDTDAALYWLARMLAGGEDPRYIARRLLRFASEDIGLADPQALGHALAAWETYERLGSPEGELAIAQCVIYLGTAPKSNAAYMASKAAARAAREHGSLEPPKHILNAPTSLMKDLGYGDGYEYDHNAEDAFSGQNYFPDDMERQKFYSPVQRGFERDIAKRLQYWDKLRRDKGRKYMIVSIAEFLILGFIVEWAFRKLTIPGLVGLLFLGVVLGPFVLELATPELLRVSDELRLIALVVILLRAGLELSKETLNRVGGRFLRGRRSPPWDPGCWDWGYWNQRYWGPCWRRYHRRSWFR